MRDRSAAGAPTTEPASFQVGQLVEWWYESRGGYGYGHWVPAVVVRDPGTANPERRVRIEAQRADGTWRERSVYARRLRCAEFGRAEAGT